MKTKLSAFTRSYTLALRKYLRKDTALKPRAPKVLGLRAKVLGLRAQADGLKILDLAKVHDEALAAIVSPSETSSVRKTMIRRAGKFFGEVVIRIELTHSEALKGAAQLKAAIVKLTKRTKELAESNQELLEEIRQRKTVEENLHISEQTSSQLLKRSSRLQKELRLLSQRLFNAQEEERKRISRDLHDVIAQTLTGINLQLGGLQSKGISDMKEFQSKIENTRRLVEKSVDLVHQFARDLRPTILDDLGLISALKSHLKGFMEKTGIRVSLTAFSGVDKLDGGKRTVLFRIVQESLNNITKHAKASLAEVRILRRDEWVRMEIHDNGKGFQVDDEVLSGEGSQRLGLLGMKERVEMVGGKFSVESAPGKETTICIEIPYASGATKKSRSKKSTKNSNMSS